MRTHTLVCIVSFLLFSLINGVLAFDCSSDAFGKILPANATVTNATKVQTDGTYGDLTGGDKDFPALATSLPSLCAVEFKVSTSTNTFSFGLFLPDKWNNRLIGTGNTGFGGGINWPYMGHLVNYGMVAFSTNTGHNSNPADASWAMNNDMGLTDWGYFAMHDSVIMAKSIINQYYQSQISHSYYMACSGGGRQGLKEMQEYPDDFDGYAVGHPPWLLTHLHPWVAYVGNVNLPNNSDAHIPEDLLGNLTDVVTAICDPQDGVTDNIVMTPWTCNFNSSQLLCQNSTETICLTPAQLPTFDAIFGAWTDPANSNGLVSPSLMLGADISGIAGGDVPSDFGLSFVEDFIVNSTSWNYSTISPATVTLADSINPGSANADNLDISPFRDKGGKIIHYHGLADTLIPPAYSIYYYEQVQKTLSANNASGLDDFYRLFLVPGMHHCSGSTGAPFYIAGGGQVVDGGNFSVPGYMDAQHDVVLAVINWVENGTAPDSIIATKWHNNSLTAGVMKQMPLCPYPKVAGWKGSGSLDEAENWECKDGDGLEVPSMTIAKMGSVSVSPNPTMGSRPGTNAAGSGMGEMGSVVVVMGLAMLVGFGLMI